MDCKKAEAQLRNRCGPKKKPKKDHNPVNKKATTLGLAHEVDQKLIGKNRKAELMGSAHVKHLIGPGRILSVTFQLVAILPRRIRRGLVRQPVTKTKGHGFNDLLFWS